MSCITKIALNLCDSQFKRKEGIDVNLTWEKLSKNKKRENKKKTKEKAKDYFDRQGIKQKVQLEPCCVVLHQPWESHVHTRFKERMALNFKSRSRNGHKLNFIDLRQSLNMRFHIWKNT